jgi:LacI family transcriptional regulator
MHGGTPPAKPVIIPPRGVVIRQSSDFLALTDQALKRAVDFIKGNLHSSPSLEQVAAAAGVSRRTLYNLFRRNLHCTPADFVDQLRFARAQQLLAAPKMTIADAARDCGFGSARTLSRQFNSREGMSAREWKKVRDTPR